DRDHDLAMRGLPLHEQVVALRDAERRLHDRLGVSPPLGDGEDLVAVHHARNLLVQVARRAPPERRQERVVHGRFDVGAATALRALHLRQRARHELEDGRHGAGSDAVRARCELRVQAERDLRVAEPDRVDDAPRRALGANGGRGRRGERREEAVLERGPVALGVGGEERAGAHQAGHDRRHLDPVPAISARSPSEKPTAPNFAVLYGSSQGTLILPPIEVTLAILPPLRSRIPWRTASVMLIGPHSWTAIISSKSACVCVASGPTAITPALLTRISIGPRRSSTEATNVSTCSRSPPSHGIATTSSPSFRRASSSCSAPRAHVATRAPRPRSSRQSANPSPREPPVTTATRPRRSSACARFHDYPAASAAPATAR